MPADTNNVDRIRSPALPGHTRYVITGQNLITSATTHAALLAHEAQSRSLLGSIGHGVVVIILVIFFIGLAIGLIVGFLVGRLFNRR
jgi:hypothetical protein